MENRATIVLNDQTVVKYNINNNRVVYKLFLSLATLQPANLIIDCPICKFHRHVKLNGVRQKLERNSKL